MTQGNSCPNTLLFYAAGVLTSVFVFGFLWKKWRDNKLCNQTDGKQQDHLPKPPNEDVSWNDRLSVLLRAHKLPDTLPEGFSDALEEAGNRFMEQGSDYIRTSVASIVDQIDHVSNVEGLEEKLQDKKLYLKKRLQEARHEWSQRIKTDNDCMQSFSGKISYSVTIMNRLNRDLRKAGCDLISPISEEQDNDENAETSAFFAVSAQLSEFAQLETALGAVLFCSYAIDLLDVSWKEVRLALARKE